jgi:hypothetical protein
MARIVKFLSMTSFAMLAFNSNCNSQVPNSLFCFSLWATSQRTNYTTALPISQDILQISNAANLVELHASLLVVQDVQPTWPKVRKGNPPGANNNTIILFVNSIATTGSATPNAEKWRWKSSSQRPSSPFHSQDWLADVSILSHSSREICYGILALSQKGKLPFKSSSHKVQLVWQQLQSTLPVSGSNTPSLHLSQSSRPHPFQVSQKTNCNNPSNKSHSWPACEIQQLCKSQFRQKHEQKLTIKLRFRFKFHQTVSTSYTVQAVSNDSLHVPLKHIHNCSSKPRMLPDASENSKPTFPNRQTQSDYVHSYSQSVVNQQHQHQVLPCLQCHDGYYLSLSLTALPCLNCQANQTASNFSSKVTSAYVRPGPLFLHTTEPQVFHYSRLISILHRFLILLMWQSNSFMHQGPCQSTARPSSFLLSYTHLQAWRQAQ